MTKIYWTAVPVLLSAVAITSLDEVPPLPEVLQATVDTFQLTFVRDGAEEPIGSLIDALDIVAEDGWMVYRRIRRYQSERVFGNRVETVVDRFPDLQPISHRVIDRMQSFRVTYSGADALAARFDPDGSVDTEYTVDAPVVNGPSLDLLLRAAPLDGRYVVTYPVWAPGRGESVVTARVDGTEAVGSGDEREIAWRVRLTSDAAQAMETILWIGQDSRQVLREEIRGPTGVLVFSR